jgi:hypothetical protein
MAADFHANLLDQCLKFIKLKEVNKLEISIADIYQKYGIPLNLQEHMLRSAALTYLLCQKWEGPSINKQQILIVMLIHDMGNFAKIDYSKEEFLPSGDKDIYYWQKKKQDFINNYGADDHVATFNIASELGFDSSILWVVLNKIFINNEMIANSDNYELKICAYADQRVGPEGIVSLKDRFDELKERYGSKSNASINHPRSEYLIKAAFDIEDQVLSYTSIESSDTLNKKISSMIEKFLQYKITLENLP